ncbi:MAG: hypothetical protein OXC14_07515, partial [Rhodospirillaceae bacterium]|nr:hypothetical protein [Rhodospirillaceae bacterium]
RKACGKETRFSAMREQLTRDREIARQLLKQETDDDASPVEPLFVHGGLMARVPAYLQRVGLPARTIGEHEGVSVGGQHKMYWFYLLDGLLHCCEDRDYEAAERVAGRCLMILDKRMRRRGPERDQGPSR